jgi:hypothetical protein
MISAPQVILHCNNYVADLPPSTARFGDFAPQHSRPRAALLAEFEAFVILASPTAGLPEATGAMGRINADQVEINLSGGTHPSSLETTTGCRALQS